MIDVPLMHALQAVPERAALILVGDVDQLPSVGRARCWRTSLTQRPCPSCA